MTSDILDLSQINSLYLFMVPNMPKNYGLYPKKVFDSKIDDVSLIEEKCADIYNTLTVIKTNYDHILVSFSKIAINDRIYLMKMKKLGEYTVLSKDKDLNGVDPFAVKSILLQSNYVDNSFGTSFISDHADSWFHEYSLTNNDSILHATSGCYCASHVTVRSFPMNMGTEHITLARSINFPGDEVIDNKFAQTLEVERCEVFEL